MEILPAEQPVETTKRVASGNRVLGTAVEAYIHFSVKSGEMALLIKQYVQKLLYIMLL